MVRATGVHLPWNQVPTEVRKWVAWSLGSELSETHDVPGGFSPGCCARVCLASGRRVFVKAVGERLNPHSPVLHRREGRIAAWLPTSPNLPRLVGQYDDGDWVALVYEEVVGRLPVHPWTDLEIDAVVSGLISVHEILTPCPVPELEPVHDYSAEMLNGWRTLASMTRPPAVLDEWSRRHADRLAELEASWPVAAAGDALVHGDVRSDNVLITETSVVLVDWPHASRGATFFDVIAWAPSVSLEGGPDPESLLRRYPAAHQADPDQINAVLAAIAGFFTYQATLPPPPGLPTLRAFQDAQGVVARNWLRDRTGLR